MAWKVANSLAKVNKTVMRAFETGKVTSDVKLTSIPASFLIFLDFF